MQRCAFLLRLKTLGRGENRLGLRRTKRFRSRMQQEQMDTELSQSALELNHGGCFATQVRGSAVEVNNGGSAVRLLT